MCYKVLYRCAGATGLLCELSSRQLYYPTSVICPAWLPWLLAADWLQDVLQGAVSLQSAMRRCYGRASWVSVVCELSSRQLCCPTRVICPA